MPTFPRELLTTMDTPAKVVTMKNKCPRCNGSGVEPDHLKIGTKLRELRSLYHISLRETARRLSMSPANVSRLERGQRRWKVSLIRKYESAVDELRHAH